jgi:hypothetical protein
MKNQHMTSTPATAFLRGTLVPMAVTAYGRGVSVAAAKRNDQDATTGFLAWSPPV